MLSQVLNALALAALLGLALAEPEPGHNGNAFDDAASVLDNFFGTR